MLEIAACFAAYSDTESLHAAITTSAIYNGMGVKHPQDRAWSPMDIMDTPEARAWRGKKATESFDSFAVSVPRPDA